MLGRRCVPASVFARLRALTSDATVARVIARAAGTARPRRRLQAQALQGRLEGGTEVGMGSRAAGMEAVVVADGEGPLTVAGAVGAGIGAVATVVS